MIQYIDKDAIMAEIERIEYETNYEPFTDEVLGKRMVCKDIKSFLDTLEVKKVDLEKEYEEFVVDDPIFGNFITNDTMGMELAKHFFELGLKTNKGE